MSLYRFIPTNGKRNCVFINYNDGAKKGKKTLCFTSKPFAIQECWAKNGKKKKETRKVFLKKAFA